MISKVKKNPTDPLGVLVAGIVQILAAAGIFSKLDMNADQIAQVGSGLLMVAATIRFMLIKHDEDTAPAAEAPAKDEEPDAASDSSEDDNDAEAPSEDDKTPVVGPPPSTDS